MTGSRAYLLAAGRGLRAGGPKAWLPCGSSAPGKTLLARQLEFLLSLFEPDRIAVSIQASWLERCLALDRRAGKVRWVGVDPAAPAMASLQALLAAAPPGSWGFAHHVDMPVWERGLFEAMASRLPPFAGCDAVVPVHAGRRGHPVALSARAAPALLALDPATGRLDRWLEGAKTLAVDLPFPCVLENWNQGAPG